MMLPLPQLVEIVPVCECAGRPWTTVSGRCRRCGGAPDWTNDEADLPHRDVWWPYTDEENER